MQCEIMLDLCVCVREKEIHSKQNNTFLVNGIIGR